MADKEDEERSEGGIPIYRHQPRERPFELAGGSPDLEAIEAHIERYVGKPDIVFHELISDLVHLDVHMVPPTAKRNYHTLITSGMSDRPMAAPPELDDCRHAELLMCLPPDWPLKEKDFKDEANYWPIRWLKTLARLPHEYDTWLFEGHTVPNGDPPEPFADNTKLCCMLVTPPMLFKSSFRKLEVSADKVIHFLALIPLYQEEVDHKLKQGTDPLLEKLAKAGVTELLDVRRKNVCKKKWFGLF